MANSRLKDGAAITAAVVALVGGFEGLRTTAYRDPIGIPTICFGETKGVRMGQVKTSAECEAMLAGSLIEHEAEMRAALVRPDALPDKVYGSFLSLEYNIGQRNFRYSTLVRRANAGDLRGACNEIPRWNKAGGKVWAGLTRRRLAEQKMCLEGLPSS